MYHTSLITSGPKSNFISDYIPTKAILFLFGCTEEKRTWLITSELAISGCKKHHSLVWYILIVYNYIFNFWITTYTVLIPKFLRYLSQNTPGISYEHSQILQMSITFCVSLAKILSKYSGRSRWGSRGLRPCPLRWRLLRIPFKICLPHQSFIPFLSGDTPPPSPSP